MLLGGGRGAPLRDGRRHCVKLEHDAHGYGITLHVWARFCFWGARLSPLSCMSMCTIIISRVTCFKLAKLVTIGAYISRERYVSSGQNFAGILSVLNLITNGWTNGYRLLVSRAYDDY